MNQKMNNFCVIPFTGIYGRYRGLKNEYRPCCEWQGGFTQEYSSAEDVWNGIEYQKVRESFNNRQMPKECSICVDDEKAGIESKRQYHNTEFSEETDYYYNNKKVIVDSPIYWDLRPSNYCNLECVMCNPENSSAISSRVETYTKTFKIKTGVLNKPCGLQEEDSFYKYMQSNIVNVKEILFAGGEPLLMPKVVEMLEWLTKNNYSKNIKLRILTNGTVYRPKWLEMLKSFKSLRVLISLDGVEEVVEYARYPNKWSVLKRNVIKYSELNTEHNCDVELNPCLHIMNFVGLHKLFAFAKQYDIPINPSLVYKGQAGKDYLHIGRIKPDIIKEEIQKCKLVLENWDRSNDSINFINNIRNTKFSMGKHNSEFNAFVNYLDSFRPIKFLEQYPYFDYMVEGD